MKKTTESLAEEHFTENDEIDLLELLVVVAENIKLLILGPLIIGALALGIAYQISPTYESVSVLQTGKIKPHLISGLVQSADILENVARELVIEQEVSPAQRVRNMQKRVVVSVGRQDNFVTITAKASTPDQAYQLNQTILQHVYLLTRPMGADAKNIQEQIKILQENLGSGTLLEKVTSKLLESRQFSDRAARLYFEVRNTNLQRTIDIANLKDQLEGLGKDNLIQNPTMPDVPIKSQKGLIAVVAALVAGMVFLIFVFARHAFRNACKNPEWEDVLSRLRAALWLKAPSKNTF